MSPARLPLLVNLSGATVAVSGSGPQAEAVASDLEARGAQVRRLAVNSDGGAEALAGCVLLVAASAEPSQDAALLAAAAARGLLAASVQGADGTRAVLGGIAEGGGLSIAAFSSAPCREFDAHAASLAAASLPEALGAFGAICAGLQARLEERFPDAERRAAIWRQVLDSPVPALLAEGLEDEARELAERMAWGTG